MKQIIIILAVLISFGQAQSQTYARLANSDHDIMNCVDYDDVLGKLKLYGYTVSSEQYAVLKQGETGYFYKTFSPDLDYIIVGISNDLNVSDIDLYAYTASGHEYDKDDSDDEIAILHIQTTSFKQLKIVIKNTESDTPNDKSTCRFVIAYR